MRSLLLSTWLWKSASPLKQPAYAIRPVNVVVNNVLFAFRCWSNLTPTLLHLLNTVILLCVHCFLWPYNISAPLYLHFSLVSWCCAFLYFFVHVVVWIVLTNTSVEILFHLRWMFGVGCCLCASTCLHSVCFCFFSPRCRRFLWGWYAG